MAKTNALYRRLQMAKTLLLLVISYVILFRWTFDLEIEADAGIFIDPWQRVFDVLANSPYMALHFWIVFAVLLYLTLGDFRNYNGLLRYGGKGRWTWRQIGELIGNALVLSVFYGLLVVIVAFAYFGLPAGWQLPADAETYVPAVYSIWYIMTSALVLRTLSCIVLGLFALYFYEKSQKRMAVVLLTMSYGLLSVLVVYFGRFLKLEYYKYLFFPGNISHYFFVSGTVWNNFLAGMVLPVLLVLVAMILLWRGQRKMEIY